MSLVKESPVENGPRSELQDLKVGWSAYDGICLGIATLLVIAAGLKGYALATSPAAGSGVFSSKPVLIGEVEAEFALAVCLLSGWRKQQMRWLTAAVFALFSCVTAYKVWTGASSCGCFGRVEVDPRYTFVLDVSLVSLLCTFGPNNNPRVPWQMGRWNFVVLASVVLAFGIGGGVAMAMYQPAVLTSDDIPDGTPSTLVVLESEAWIGKRFPLLKHVDVGAQFETGSWVVVLHREDCHTCQQALPLYRELASEGEFVAGRPEVALIEMPGPGISHFGPNGRHLIYGKLQPTRDWFATTPVAMLLHDGVVIAAASGEEAANLEWLARATSTDNHTRLIGKPLTVEGKQLGDGAAFSTTVWKGKVVLVDFWATWCGPCIRSLPELQSLYKKYHSQGLEIVSVSIDQGTDPVQKFLASSANKVGMPWPQLFPGQALADQLGVQSIPTVVLLDSQGIVRFAANPPSNLEERISRLLNSK
jgi:thiol-disulfide isomerase/thioredoxin